jgi:hypothetical protein
MIVKQGPAVAAESERSPRWFQFNAQTAGAFMAGACRNVDHSGDNLIFVNQRASRGGGTPGRFTRNR